LRRLVKSVSAHAAPLEASSKGNTQQIRSFLITLLSP